MAETTPPEKAIVSVAELARTLGLSRSRFYQLVVGGIFPAPKRNEQTKRPFYDIEGQQTCLDVRRRNCGVNGRPILFYSRRRPASPPPSVRLPSESQRSPARKKPSRPVSSGTPKEHGLLDGLRQLGLNDLSEEKVAAAVHACFSQGASGSSEQDVLLAVFRHLVRQNSGGNVG